MIRVFVNVYDDPVPARNAELKEALRRNRENPAIDRVVTYGGRPTFSEVFGLANSVVGFDDISVIINSDICFDESISLLENIERDECYALARVDMSHRRDSTDAWVFRGQIPPIKADFTMGIRGCDNHLNWSIKESGLKISNPCKSIRAIHLHESQVRRYRHERQFHIPEPYLLVDPCELKEKV